MLLLTLAMMTLLLLLRLLLRVADHQDMAWHVAGVNARLLSSCHRREHSGLGPGTWKALSIITCVLSFLHTSG